jgi:hypothetical protein
MTIFCAECNVILETILTEDEKNWDVEACFPPGEIFCANREKSNLIGWQQTLCHHQIITFTFCLFASENWKIASRYVKLYMG